MQPATLSSESFVYLSAFSFNSEHQQQQVNAPRKLSFILPIVKSITFKTRSAFLCEIKLFAKLRNASKRRQDFISIRTNGLRLHHLKVNKRRILIRAKNAFLSLLKRPNFSIPSSPSFVSLNITTGPPLYNTPRSPISPQSLTYDLRCFNSFEPPPINRWTLRELDLHVIASDIQLRHNLLFDNNLQFRSQRNPKALDTYWNDIDSHFQKADYSTVPSLVLEIKAILKDLEIDATTIDSGLIWQEIQNNVLDVESLIAQIGHYMKLQCAPMRDEMIEAMCRESKNRPFAETLRCIFNLLETMKIDLANHHLLEFRPHAISNAVNYEHKSFMERLQCGMGSIEYTEMWLGQYREKKASFLAEAVVDLVMDYSTWEDSWPETFDMDKKRLKEWSANVMDTTLMGVLMLFYRQFVGVDSPDLKERIRILLKEEDISIENIGAELWLALCEVKNVKNVKYEKIVGLVQSAFQSNSPLFKAVKSKVRRVLKTFLRSNKFEIANGIEGIQEELLSVCHNLSKLYNHNKSVHFQLYNDIYANQ